MRRPRSDYIIGAGDTLQVFVWRNPELSVTGVLSEYVRSPKVNIIVATAASAFSLVKVVEQRSRA